MKRQNFDLIFFYFREVFEKDQNIFRIIFSTKNAYYRYFERLFFTGIIGQPFNASENQMVPLKILFHFFIGHWLDISHCIPEE